MLVMSRHRAERFTRALSAEVTRDGYRWRRGWQSRYHHHHTVRTLAVIDTGQRAGLALDEIKLLLSASPDDGEAIDRLREVADRKLPQITALIERSQLVRHELECAARCECPNLDQCPLFDDPPINAAPRPRLRPPASAKAGPRL